VFTQGIKNVGINNVTAYANITGRGVSAKGFCWDTINIPNLNKNFTNEGDNSNAFSSQISNILPDKKYYLFSYVTSSLGTAFSDVKEFVTFTPPKVNTYTITANSFSTAMANGSVAISNSFTPIELGFCYDSKPNPSITNTKRTSSIYSAFAANLTSLTPNTTYYLKAYATYSFGTIYGNEVNFKTPLAPMIYNISGTMSDIDGNTYNTVTIGNQTWMTENLKVTNYRDGSPIPYSTSSWSVLTVGGRGALFGNTSLGFGYLYNYRAILDAREIAPAGWHIPTKLEWQTLIDNLGGNFLAMSQMASLNNWSSVTCSRTNNSAMSIFGGGVRGSDGIDVFMNFKTNFWTSKNDNATAFEFNNSCIINSISGLPFNTGCYIRCVKD
jgi:uncharacterized protein (TIGR02145 family)